jgi:hypothetical protein
VHSARLRRTPGLTTIPVEHGLPLLLSEQSIRQLLELAKTAQLGADPGYSAVSTN